MRTRIALFSIILLAFSLNVDAQFKYGIRGGINTNVKLNDFSGSDYTLEYAKGDMGFHIGVMAQVKLLNIFIQPELLFTTSKTDIQLINREDLVNPIEELGKQNFNKIDIPVMAGVKIGPLKIQAGPVGTMMLKSKSDLLDKYNMEQNFKGITLGYQAGIGLELSSLLLDVKYEGNLSKLGDGVAIAGTDYSFDQRMSQWILSIGFLLGE